MILSAAAAERHGKGYRDNSHHAEQEPAEDLGRPLDLLSPGLHSANKTRAFGTELH